MAPNTIPSASVALIAQNYPGPAAFESSSVLNAQACVQLQRQNYQSDVYAVARHNGEVVRHCFKIAPEAAHEALEWQAREAVQAALKCSSRDH